MGVYEINSLRILDAVQIIYTAFSILKQKWLSFAAPFVVFAVIKTYAEAFLIKNNVVDLSSPNIEICLFGALVLLFFEATLIRITDSFVVQMAADLYLGRETSLSKSLKSAHRVILSVLLTALLVSLIIMAGLVMLLIPAILFGIMFSVAIEVVVLERKSVFKAIHRSRELTARNWLHIFGVVILSNVIATIGSIVSNMLNPIFIQILGETLGSLSIEIIYDGALLPLNAVISTVLYFDLLARKTSSISSS